MAMKVMLSFPLKNLFPPSSVAVILTNYWKHHPSPPSNASFPSFTACKHSTLSFFTKPKPNSIAAASSSDSIQERQHEEEAEEEYKVVTAMRSNYNDIVIVDTAKSRMLLLDPTHNVHSILNKDQKWTGSYWDEFVSLPAIIPEGPVAILGLGAGTAAHLMLDLWPTLELEGWEIDPIVIDQARQYFGLLELEKPTPSGGRLHIHIDDALSPAESYSRKYAGIVVDLFYQGKVLPQLQEVATWLELKDRLMSNGRLMVNCGGINEKPENANGIIHPQSAESTWTETSNIEALSEAFHGQVNWKRMPETQGANYLALTGPLPDLALWSSKLPHPISENVKRWSPCASIS